MHKRSFVVRSGKPENDAGDVVLSIVRKTAGHCQRLIEELRHRKMVANERG